MIVKMKFLSISGPRTDIDRVSASYLSKYEMQLENAITELKTTDNLMPFMDVNPYKEPLSKAEQYVLMLAQPKGEMDTSLTADEILTMIRDLNHDYLDLKAREDRLKKQKEEFLAIIRSVLEDCVKNGISKKSLLAGINSMEFKFREADFGAYPKGLMYGLQCLDSWIYDEKEPFMHIEAIETYAFLKEQTKGRYFEELVQKYLLDNTHVSVVITKPQKGLNAENEKALEEKLAAYKATLSKEEIDSLIADTRHLKEYQEEPSPKEDLEKIPLLKREDLKKEIVKLTNEECEVAGVPALYHDVFTSGIHYVDFMFDIKHIRQEDLPYVGLLKAVLGYVDTEHYGYADLSNEIDLQTGGISNNILGTADVENIEEYSLKFEVRTKFLEDKTGAALRLVKEILCSSDLDDEKRLYEIIAQSKSRLQMAIGGMGHYMAGMRAMSYFSKTAKISDLTGGIELYKIVADLEEHFEEKKEELKATLKRLVKEIFVRERLMLNITSAGGTEFLEQELQMLLESLPSDKTPVKPQEILCEKKNEGFLDASKVQYVSRAGNFVEKGYSYTGTLRILKVIMGYDYLWINIRVKGGAYGCMSGFGKNGDTYFASYRDPKLRATNEIYEKIPEYLKEFDADERDMTKYIIGTISGIDQPLEPAALGDRSFHAYQSGVTVEMIQKERNQVLDATEETIRSLAGYIETMMDAGTVCAIGNDRKLEEEKELFKQVSSLTQ